MRYSRFTVSQIVAILNETEASVQVKEVWRKHGISIDYIEPRKPNRNWAIALTLQQVR